MKSIKKELEKGKKEEKVKVKAEKLKKEFKIEIVKVGKLEENTAGTCGGKCGGCYDCSPA